MKLREAGLSKISVGSVQDFQGQEVKVVIISTVLTSCLKTPDDHTESVGLVGDHRKFNVAVTRGMACCVVVGEPYTLMSDRSWKEYIEACDRKGTYTGYDCKLLEKHYRRTEEKDADALLEMAAHIALKRDSGREAMLGGMTSSADSYYKDEITWRTLL